MPKVSSKFSDTQTNRTVAIIAIFSVIQNGPLKTRAIRTSIFITHIDTFNLFGKILLINQYSGGITNAIKSNTKINCSVEL